MYLNFSIPQQPTTTGEPTKTPQEHRGWKISPEGLQKFTTESENWSLTAVETTEELYEQFTTLFNKAMDSCFSPIKQTTKQHPNVNKENMICYKPLLTVVKILTLFIHKGKSERFVAKKYIDFLQQLQKDNYL